jgi:putative aldouronate transport system substrate-binding protein
VAAVGAKPDLPGNAAGLQDAFTTFPKTLVKSVPQPPGTGGDVTVVVQTTGAVPPPVDQNAAWQALNKALNVNLKLQLASAEDYTTKMGTLMAGSDLPDILYIDANVTIGNIPQFLKAAYSDLTPFIAGDAIKDYPNLAAFPTLAWKQAAYDGAIYGVPVIRPFQFGTFINQSMFDAANVGQPKNGDDFKRILKEITKPAANQYGMAQIAPAYGLQGTGKGEVPFLSIFGAANNWSVDSSGKFTKDFETDQFKTALQYMKDLYDAKVLFPDPTLNQTTMRTAFTGNKVGVISTGWSAYGALLWDIGAKAKPPIKFRTLLPFSADGTSKPIWHQSNGLNGITAIKKGSADRVKELLRILNFFAAPFGTEEYTLIKYGVKDVDYTFDSNGNPVATPKGQSEMTIYNALFYITRSLDVLFDQNDPSFATAASSDEAAMVAGLVPDPSVGLYSPTERSKNGQLLQKVSDGFGQIVTGRSPISSLDQLVKDWRSAGGDQMRMEFQQAYAASK